MKTTAKLTQQQLNDRANALNRNLGTPGTNKTNAQTMGNRGKQLNPNQIANDNQKSHRSQTPDPRRVNGQGGKGKKK